MFTSLTKKNVFKQCVFYLEDVAEVSRPAHYSLMTHLHCWALMRLMSPLRIDVAQLNFAIHLDCCPVTFHENFHSIYFHVRFLAMNKLFDYWMRTQWNTEKKMYTVVKKCKNDSFEFWRENWYFQIFISLNFRAKNCIFLSMIFLARKLIFLGIFFSIFAHFF